MAQDNSGHMNREHILAENRREALRVACELIKHSNPTGRRIETYLNEVTKVATQLNTFLNER